MTQFWLATFAIDLSTDASAVGPILAAATRTLAIEVLRDGDNWAVLFSTADNPLQPAELTCLVGFTNLASACNLWLDRGFPLVDATIDRTAPDPLRVISPCFLRDQVAMRYDTQLFALGGVELDAGTADAAWLAPSYRQQLLTPDDARPDTLTMTVPVVWMPKRTNVRTLSPAEVSQVRLDLGDLTVRVPSLAPLQTGAMRPAAAWSGDIDLPHHALEVGCTAERQKAAPAFGPHAFRFEDVDIVGFRIDLNAIGGDVRSNLAKLVKPLNFHLSEGTGLSPASGGRKTTPDFRYRAATSTLIIELLRYGGMRTRIPFPPVGIDDTQSQHELAVRVLVGRVDDDTAQAHDPAVYVPTIFVDNPWSKMLGRDAIGYDKRLAEFCVRRADLPERLLPDGRSTTAERSRLDNPPRPEPLRSISSIRLVGRTGGDSSVPLLDLTYSSKSLDDEDVLLPVDLDLAFGSSPLAGARWRQSDFDEGEFRRSFASAAVAESVRAFRSIQVAPVAERGTVGPSWVTGTFIVDDNVRAALPTGFATLTFHATRNAPLSQQGWSTPDAWNLVCDMLGGGDQVAITLAPGSWYRLNCSMDLTIDDGLDWALPGR